MVAQPHSPVACRPYTCDKVRVQLLKACLVTSENTPALQRPAEPVQDELQQLLGLLPSCHPLPKRRRLTLVVMMEATLAQGAWRDNMFMGSSRPKILHSLGVTSVEACTEQELHDVVHYRFTLVAERVSQ
mmetsp:Transcript_24918/g.57942  ORF Transcript_24918/g.57942 Transcript_24918/m.57942 type:complete len:130 (+) Transcript_24918:34-423(+)|eukprot:CAMPEP_0171084146 /NCGR_PEP_ID=MMETSP0766_2-20121228/18140_1 /TAXON_ID=439317 /ORGANISM="Gambierdiscus australes, Strain CAWD 149" /LENGTH=129 /DNA_ID=CAMNT_0011541631 /DNA_START=26 /DNA_END=415 /DNA_ORIENTATION=+